MKTKTRVAALASILAVGTGGLKLANAVQNGPTNLKTEFNKGLSYTDENHIVLNSLELATATRDLCLDDEVPACLGGQNDLREYAHSVVDGIRSENSLYQIQYMGDISLHIEQARLASALRSFNKRAEHATIKIQPVHEF